MGMEVNAMTSSRTLTTTVQPGGRIEVSAPDLPVGQPVEVTVRATDLPGNSRRSVVEILSECPGGVVFKTAEEVDNHIRRERESWER
jgi:hypothetical protein